MDSDLALTCFITHASSHMQQPVCCTQTTSTSLYYTVYTCILLISVAATCPCFYGHYLISRSIMLRTFASTSKSFVLFLHLSIVTARSAHYAEHAMTPDDMVIVAIYSSLCLRCLFSRHLLCITLSQLNPLAFLLVGLMLETYMC